MIIAFLFNWRAYPYEENYWELIREAVFAPGIIQKSDRHMKLSIGDVLVGLKQGQDAANLYIAAFGNSEWGLVDEDRLIDGFPTVFGIVFENMPRTLASELAHALLPHQGFLGAISVHFEIKPHLALYRSRLPLKYRVRGKRLRSFYSMGETDGCDPCELQEMKSLGFKDVAFEDTGMGRTILDDFDTPRHFERVAAFRELVASNLGGGEDAAYELAMMLEDLSPKLFNVLGAAAERLASAENEEEVAQVAISGRRYLEQLADALFPAIDNPRGKRILNKAAYKNRLWAFAEEHTQNNPDHLLRVGKDIDKVVGEFNSGVHSTRVKSEIERSICNAAVLTGSLFSLAPDSVRNGYLAYADSWQAFIQELGA